MKKTKNMYYNETAESRELELYTMNAGRVWERFMQPAIDNLTKKCARGAYDSEKAIMLFYRVTSEASKCYGVDFGYTFDVTARYTAAVNIEKEIKEMYLEA